MVRGRPKQFPVDYETAKIAIDKYKDKVNSGIIKNPSIDGFLGTIDANTQEFVDVIENPVDTNIPLSKLLKNFATWLNGEIIERSSGSHTPLATMMLKQGFSGYRYTDRQDVKADTKVEINVKFGGKSKDPFG